MAKVKINSKLINLTDNECNTCNTIGIIRQDNINFKDNNINVIINLNDLTLKRKCIEYDLFLDFKNHNGIYNIYNLNRNLNLKIKIDKINQINNYLYIKYNLFVEDELIGKYKYEFSYEVI